MEGKTRNPWLLALITRCSHSKSVWACPLLSVCGLEAFQALRNVLKGTVFCLFALLWVLGIKRGFLRCWRALSPCWNSALCLVLRQGLGKLTRWTLSICRPCQLCTLSPPAQASLVDGMADICNWLQLLQVSYGKPPSLTLYCVILSLSLGLQLVTETSLLGLTSSFFCLQIRGL